MRRLPPPPTMIGTPPGCTGVDEPRVAVHRVVRPVVLEGRPGGRRPQAGDDGELLLEPVEALADRREGDAEGGVLLLEPARAQPELDPPAAHLVDPGDGHGERPGQPERGRADQGAEPDAAGVAGEPGEGGPGVGGPGGAVAGHVQVVVGAEEAVEAQLLGGAGHREEVVVGRTLLGLGEDPEVHAPTLGGGARARGRQPPRRTRRRPPGHQRRERRAVGLRLPAGRRRPRRRPVDSATPVEIASPCAALTRPCSLTGASESSWVDSVGETMPMPRAATPSRACRARCR